MKRKLSLLTCLLAALWLSGCGEAGEQPAQNANAANANQAGVASPGSTPFTMGQNANGAAAGAAGARATATFRAEPNPIRVCDNSGSGKTTLVWDVRGAHRVQVRVGTPDGSVMADSSQMQGRAETGNWVTDGAQFFLQDASGPRPTTLANVTVKVTKEGCP